MFVHGVDERQADLIGLQRPVRLHRAGEQGAVARCAGRVLERPREALVARGVQRQAGRHGVAAEAAHHVRRLLRHEVQRVAQVHAFDRAAGTAQLRLAGARERDGRAMELLLHARGDQSDDTLVPVLVEQADGACRLDGVGIQRGERIELHVALDVAALAVQLVQLLRQLERALEAVGRQALDAHRHVGQASGGVDARADREAEVHRPCRAGVLARHLEQRRHAGVQPAVADPLQALRDEDAVVAVEAHDVGDGAEGDEVEQRVELRLRGRREAPARPQLGAQREQHVEHDAHARQVLAGKAAARLVRVDDARGGRQDRSRQVMVGDQDGDAEVVGAGHALDAGDVDDLGRESVAVLEAVRHQVADVRAERAQSAQSDRARRGAIAVVVGHDQQAGVGLDRIGEQRRRVVHVRQRRRRHQPVDQQLQFIAPLYPASGQHPGERGQHAIGDELLQDPRVGVTDEQAGHSERT